MHLVAPFRHKNCNKWANIFMKKNAFVTNKLVQSSFTIKKDNSSNWFDSVNQNIASKVFDISKDIDKQIPDSYEMSEAIIENWHNRELGKNYIDLINNLIALGKKYPLEEDINTKVSDKMYEMF